MRQGKPAPSGAMTFEAFGVAFNLVLVDDPAPATQVQGVLPPGCRSRPQATEAKSFTLRRTPADDYEVAVGDELRISQPTLDNALGLLDAQIRLYIATHASEHIFVHAGVVAHDGIALVAPGKSYSGKTSLVRALVQAGATYYSDEYAVFDDEGRVLPYPRRLSLRGADGVSTEERHVAELGGVAGVREAELGLVLLTHYRPESDWRPRRVSAAEGVMGLLANAVPAQERPKQSLEVLTRALDGALVLEGERGEADKVAGAVLEHLSRHGT